MAASLRHLVSRQESVRHYVIFTDSQAAMQRVQGDFSGAAQEIALEAIAWAEDLHRAGNTVTVRWVPGHRGVEDNEMADLYARSTAEWLPRRRGGGYCKKKSLASLKMRTNEKATRAWREDIERRQGRGRPFQTPTRSPHPRVRAELGGAPKGWPRDSIS